MVGVTIHTVNDTYATVGAQEDIDGATRRVVVKTNRTDPDAPVLHMTPKVARALARRLNRWARLVDSK